MSADCKIATRLFHFCLVPGWGTKQKLEEEAGNIQGGTEKAERERERERTADRRTGTVSVSERLVTESHEIISVFFSFSFFLFFSFFFLMPMRKARVKWHGIGYCPWENEKVWELVAYCADALIECVCILN